MKTIEKLKEIAAVWSQNPAMTRNEAAQKAGAEPAITPQPYQVDSWKVEPQVSPSPQEDNSV